MIVNVTTSQNWKEKEEKKKKKTKIGNHPPELLAKFGYRPDMKVNNFKNPFYILATYRNLFVEIFVCIKIIFVKLTNVKICPPKKMVKDYPKAKKLCWNGAICSPQTFSLKILRFFFYKMEFVTNFLYSFEVTILWKITTKQISIAFHIGEISIIIIPRSSIFTFNTILLQSNFKWQSRYIKYEYISKMPKQT
jgi:hypothetical protein